MRCLNCFLAICLGTLFVMDADAQSGFQKGSQIKINLSDDGKEYLRFTFLNQTWLRYTDANPGTTVNGYAQNQIFDIGLRRTRMQFFGQISPRVFFYTQFGMNNFTSNSKQYQGAFFHDAVSEFRVHDKMLSIGAGLTGWSGLSRYASPSVGSILSLDAPLYQQATNGINDQFLRKLSVYAKGKIGKLDYRLALSKPMAVQNAVASVNVINAISDFSLMPGKLQTQSYVMYQFLDQEDNTNPYTVGTYLGKKRIFNIGAGVIYQQDAMWHLDVANDTASSQMLLLGLDVFYEAPLNEEKLNAISVYAAYNKFDFGTNYVRNVGVMNPANGTNSSGTFNGSGNGYPMIGTGHTLYLQVGYLFRKELIGDGTIQLFAGSQYSSFDRLNDNVLIYEGGLNWLIEGTHNSKLSLNYQSRPIFETQSNAAIINTQRKGMVQLQYQILI